MAVRWEKFIAGETGPARQASLRVRASIVGRVGLLLLSSGTGAWRVRDSMNTVARALNMTCSADIGFTSLVLTSFDGVESFTESLSLASTGVNTDQLTALQDFVQDFALKWADQSALSIHQELDRIKARPANYSALQSGLAGGLACAGFIFLLGGGLIEMVGCFFGAGLGQFTRKKFGQHHWTAIATTAIGVAVACLAYFLALHLLGLTGMTTTNHEAGYIGAMLFVIPGFPYITSILDISKNDLRSGLERLTFALTIIITATLVGWLLALVFGLQPKNFLPLGLGQWPLMFGRLAASFAGVFGFSIMFNSRIKMAATAGLIGAIANTTRLELIDLSHFQPAAAAFVGALIAGLLASLIHQLIDYPRITITVPSIVIMVPGLYIYRGVYNLGLNQIGTGAAWLTKAILIMAFLPLGLFVARFCFDAKWRKID
nr:threonine/serine exporter family protein [Fructobacillus ficulneus]